MIECLLILSRTIVVFVVVEVLVVHLLNCSCLRALNLLLCALLSKQIKNDIISVFYGFIIGLTIRSLLTLIGKLCGVGGTHLVTRLMAILRTSCIAHIALVRLFIEGFGML